MLAEAQSEIPISAPMTRLRTGRHHNKLHGKNDGRAPLTENSMASIVFLLPISCLVSASPTHGYASISPVTDQSEHSILISIEQILISIERSARYELVLVPVDGHTVLGYRTSAAVAGGKRAAWAAGDKVDGRLSAVPVAEVRAHAVRTVTSPVSHLVAYLCQLRSTVSHRSDHLEGTQWHGGGATTMLR